MGENHYIHPPQNTKYCHGAQFLNAEGILNAPFTAPSEHTVLTTRSPGLHYAIDLHITLYVTSFFKDQYRLVPSSSRLVNGFGVGEYIRF